MSLIVVGQGMAALQIVVKGLSQLFLDGMVYLQSLLEPYAYLGSERVYCKTDRVFNKGMGYYTFEFIVFMCGWDELIESDCFIFVKGKYL